MFKKELPCYSGFCGINTALPHWKQHNFTFGCAELCQMKVPDSKLKVFIPFCSSFAVDVYIFMALHIQVQTFPMLFLTVADVFSFIQTQLSSVNNQKLHTSIIKHMLNPVSF